MKENNVPSAVIKNLTKSYGGFTALRDVNLVLPKGKIIGLLGPNGSGKTTLIKILTGLITNYQGEVLVEGRPVGADTKALISYLPDRNYFADWMRARDAIFLFSDMYADFNGAKAFQMIDRLGLNANQKIKSMSKGMIDKFQLCLVMSREAHLYVLDEPLGGVDPAARDFILDTVLKNYSEDSSVIISTHLISDVERIFDTVIFLKQGEIMLCDEIDTLREKTQKSVDQLFREVFKC
ncbi:ABC transporter ATP-binding protein [Zongyangia hominis]|uniref:ABC transporter ATP-binding protein n=1 Tax=Zongyangia hominis TaxID=2763677 RepID=A0A926EES2_9FIRM|nr:ABC transporter ATP-binding protein [Zongyangia hominis]MBC8570741.1 ABC transporter ATP-binding protein [Zongyangia hominis]